MTTFLYPFDVDLQSWLSSLSRKLKLIFSTSQEDSATDTIDLDIVAVNMDKDCMQVSFMYTRLFDDGDFLMSISCHFPLMITLYSTVSRYS